MGEFLEEVKAQKVDRSSLGKIKAQLSEEDFFDLMIALGDPRITAPAILRALATRNIKVANSTITMIRRGLNEAK